MRTPAVTLHSLSVSLAAALAAPLSVSLLAAATLAAQVRERPLPQIPLQTQPQPIKPPLDPSRLARSLPTIYSKPTSPTTVVIGWTPIQGAVRYQVRHGPIGQSGQLAFTRILATVPGNVTEVTDDHMVAGVTLGYLVEAYTDTTSTQPAYTITGGTALSAPGVAPQVTATCQPTANPGLQSCTWTWQPVTGAVSYIVTDGASPSSPCYSPPHYGSTNHPVTATQYTATNVPYVSAPCKRTYTFRGVLRWYYPTPQGGAWAYADVPGPFSTWEPTQEQPH